MLWPETGGRCQIISTKTRTWCWASPELPWTWALLPSHHNISGQCDMLGKSQKTKATNFIDLFWGKSKFSIPQEGGKSNSQLFAGGCVQSETAQLEDALVIFVMRLPNFTDSWQQHMVLPNTAF